jgi:membrane associated rhomboid family serine protease
MFTDAIKTLIAINLGLWALSTFGQNQIDLSTIFGLSPGTVWPKIWQPITYMFIHGGFMHVAINMFVLWMFGSEMENIWGRSEFLKYYFLTGVGSGLIWLLVNAGNSAIILIGASGAVYGVLLAYGLMFPNRTVLLYFIIPVKVKWLVIFLGVVAFLSSMTATSNISHLAHLSGMAIGYIYLKYSHYWKGLSINFRRKVVNIKSQVEERKEQRRTMLKQEMNQILDKMNQSGYQGLGDYEKERLQEISQLLSEEEKKD